MVSVDAFPFVHRESVRFRDLDALGHVNNAVFLTYLEQARFSFLQHLGLVRGPQEPGMIVARVEIDFRSQATMGDEMEIAVRPSRLGTKSFDLDYELRVDGRLVAEATTVLVAYDYANNTSKEIPAEWRQRLAA